jgi:hypothetical protein
MTPAEHETIKRWMNQQHPELAKGECAQCQRTVERWGFRLLPFPDPNLAPLLTIACPLCGHVLVFDSLLVGLRPQAAGAATDQGSG